MKKTLIALAVLSAAGVASAQSSVTLYGLADVYLGSTKVKTTNAAGVSSSLRQTVINSGGFGESRFGLTGSEDLGGGLKANFVLEGGVDVSTGAGGTSSTGSSSVFSRNSWVGFSGGFGSLKLGRMWSPYDEVKGLGAGAFNEIFAPANANVWASNNYIANPGNAIYYSTPNLSGFSAAALYAFGENKTGAAGTPPNTDAGRLISVNARYAGGPVDVALSHQQEKANGAATTVKFTQVNASYDLSVAKIRAAYGQVKNGTTSLFAVAPATIAFDKSREFQVGVDVPLGNALTLSTGVARGKLTLAAGGGEVKSTGFGLAAKYELSKRTFFYTGLLLAKNDGPGSSEVKTDTFALGVQHKF